MATPTFLSTAKREYQSNNNQGKIKDRLVDVFFFRPIRFYITLSLVTLVLSSATYLGFTLQESTKKQMSIAFANLNLTRFFTLAWGSGKSISFNLHPIYNSPIIELMEEGFNTEEGQIKELEYDHFKFKNFFLYVATELNRESILEEKLVLRQAILFSSELEDIEEAEEFCQQRFNGRLIRTYELEKLHQKSFSSVQLHHREASISSSEGDEIEGLAFRCIIHIKDLNSLNKLASDD